MGKETGIEWTDHTFNPWWGCTKVSPGCANCYAERDSKRWGQEWGKGAPRRLMSPGHWQQPLAWDAAAQRDGVRRRVFCASMADVFEEEAPAGELDRLWGLIRRTPHLDWQLLTKRPHLIASKLPADWGEGFPNVWLGTSVEDQKRADERIRHLVAVPARVRFLSCEPLLGPVDLASVITYAYGMTEHRTNVLTGETLECSYDGGAGITVRPNQRIHWVIAGGESGPNARPMHHAWVRGLRDQCASSGAAFFFKQWGEWLPDFERPFTLDADAIAWGLVHLAGAFRLSFDGKAQIDDPSWKDGETGTTRVGKKRAGRDLDGVTYQEMPA